LGECVWRVLFFALAGESQRLAEEEAWASAIRETLQMSTPKRAQATALGEAPDLEVSVLSPLTPAPFYARIKPTGRYY
jgi:hypothetical protein